jgi:hypothetical protein
VSARLPTADDNRLRPGLRVVYVKGEQKYPRKLTSDEVVAVELATKGERFGGMRWPKGWAERIGKPESWRWPEMLEA